MNFDWAEVWDRKGKSNSVDRLFLSGLDKLDFKVDLKAAAKILTRVLDIQPSDRVLDIGCASGAVAQYLDCKYIGIDQSEAMIKKTIAINGFSAVVCDADNTIFRDKVFDKVFVLSVFQYFPNHEYARKVIKEIERLTKKSAYIGDVPIISHDKNHCLYTADFFDGWEISDPYYPREHRFSVIKHFNG